MIFKEVFGCVIHLEENAMTIPLLYVYINPIYLYLPKIETYCLTLYISWLGTSHRYTQGDRGLLICEPIGDCDTNIRRLCWSPYGTDKRVQSRGADEILVSGEKNAQKWSRLATRERHGCSKSEAYCLHFYQIKTTNRRDCVPMELHGRKPM